MSASWTNVFDANGNRTKLTRTGSTGITGNKTFTYNAANQLTSSSGQTASWTYDDAGNQTRDGSGLVTSYGDRSQVTAIGSNQHSNFGTGNADRYATGSTLKFDNGALGLMRRTNESTSEHTYTRTAEGTALGFKASDGARLYYITDHLGSVVGIFDSSGDYLGGYSYSPDGEQRFVGTNGRVTGNQLRYIGELTVGGGLYKFGARYYDASQARFTQMDPSGQEKNPYTYGSNNPVVNIDPIGLSGYCAPSVGCTGYDEYGNPIYADGPDPTSEEQAAANGCFLSLAATVFLPAPPITVAVGAGLVLYCVGSL